MTTLSGSTVRLGHVASVRGGDSVVDRVEEADVPVYGAGGRLGFTTKANAAAGEVIVGRVGSVGSLRLLSSEAWATDNTLVISLELHKVEPRFVIYSLREIPVAQITSGTAMPLVTGSKLMRQAIPLPPLSEQRVIADYLDRETARIDTLMGEQQRLIEILHERRQAVIDDAFAGLGGLRSPLRRHIKFLTSGSRGWGDFYADDGQRFLRIGNMPRKSITIRGEVQCVDLPSDVTEGSRTMLHAGDLLFSITAYLGSVAVVDQDWVGAYVSQHVALCRLDSMQSDSKFIAWFMLTTAGQNQLKEGAVGGTKLQLALDDIKNLLVPAALMPEQRHIAVHLEKQTEKIDMLIAETDRFIELSRERRAALITAAVTGQIDVQAVA